MQPQYLNIVVEKWTIQKGDLAGFRCEPLQPGADTHISYNKFKKDNQYMRHFVKVTLVHGNL